MTMCAAGRQRPGEVGQERVGAGLSELAADGGGFLDGGQGLLPPPQAQTGSPTGCSATRPVRLAAFKGNTQLKAGHLPQATETLLAVLADRSIQGDKQRTVILGDLAAIEAAQHHPEAACDYAIQALDQLGRTWYATGMDRVLEVRKALQPNAELDCVQALDDRLYDWQATLSTLQR